MPVLGKSRFWVIFLIALASSDPAAHSSSAIQASAVPPRRLDTHDAKDPVYVIANARSLVVRSSTVYLESKHLAAALRQRPEFAAWGVAIASTENADPSNVPADLYLEVSRPFLSFDWRFRLLVANTETVVGSGRVVAWDGPRAAVLITAQIVERFKAVRDGSVRGSVAAERKQRRWPAKYVSGSASLKAGSRLDILLDEKTLTAMAQNEKAFSIPLHSVLAINHSSRERNPSQGWNNFWTGVASSGCREKCVMESPGGGLGMVAVLGAAMLLDEVLKSAKTVHHSVNVAWLEQGTAREVVFQVGEKHYESLLAELSRRANRPPTDFPAQLEELQRELQAQAGKSVIVYLDRPVQVGWQKLVPGHYRMVVLEREDRPDEVYFYAGGYSDARLVVGHALVQVDPSGAGGAAEVSYKEENGFSSIAEIRLAERTLRFNAVPVASEVRTSGPGAFPE